jgi:hypothetical protein
MLKGALNTAINQLIEKVNIKVLNKRKLNKLEKDDSVTLLGNKIKFFYDIFGRFR